VADLNHAYRSHSALFQQDCLAEGFEWIASHDEANSVFAWLRHDDQGGAVMVVCNLTPVPRPGYRIGSDPRFGAWRELVNTDSSHYGGSNVGNGDSPVPVEPISAHGRGHSVALNLPPLGVLFLVPT
jgi:1,4-alpha-glucan branching enzyme